MISLEEWVDIVALHRSGLSIKAIVRTLGISRNAVRRALRRDGPPQRAPRLRASKLDPYKDYLLARLAEFPELTAAALCEEIRAMGYEVREAPPVEEKQRLANTRQAILDDLAAGKITSEEAVKRLQEA